MDLWIRSQDRETIMKIDRVDIDREKEIWVNGYDVFVAKYKTKERALEVLDEMQEFIENRDTTKITQDIHGITSEVEIAKRVYEMPQE